MNRNYSKYVEQLLKKGYPPITSADATRPLLIDEIENTQEVTLPSSISRLIKFAGNRLFELNTPFAEMELLPGLKIEAQRLLAVVECGRLTLPEQAFVFSMPSGEEFYFAICNNAGNDDPEAYYYYVDYEKVSAAGSFWRLMMDSLASVPDKA